MLNFHEEPAAQHIKDIPERDILFFDVKQSFKFKGFLDIGSDDVAIIMEDQTDYNLNFLRISDVSSQKGTSVKLKSCGMHDNARNQIMSPIVDLRSVMQEVDGQSYHVAVALRENGQLDFYSDFRLVDQSLATEKFIKIECDFKQFYFIKTPEPEP